MHPSCSSDGRRHERRRKVRGGAARPAAADGRSGAAVVHESSAAAAVSSVDPDSTRISQNHLPATAFVDSRLPFFPRISGTAAAAVCLLKIYIE